MSLDQEHLEAHAFEKFPFLSLTAACKDAVAGFIFGNVVFPIIIEVLRVAPSIFHVGPEGKCVLEVGPVVAIVPHCLVRVPGTEYFHLFR